MTVGTDTPIMKALRPGADSLSKDNESSTVPVEALEVSSSGTSALTLTASVRAPTSNFRSSVTNCCVPIRMPARSIGVKPASEAFSPYEPGSSAAKLYSPLSFVTVVRERLVASFVSVTSTPGTTAPPASLTDPRRPPWKPCPSEAAEIVNTATKENAVWNLIAFLTTRHGALPDGGCRRILPQAFVKVQNQV